MCSNFRVESFEVSLGGRKIMVWGRDLRVRIYAKGGINNNVLLWMMKICAIDISITKNLVLNLDVDPKRPIRTVPLAHRPNYY